MLTYAYLDNLISAFAWLGKFLCCLAPDCETSGRLQVQEGSMMRRCTSKANMLSRLQCDAYPVNVINIVGQDHSQYHILRYMTAFFLPYPLQIYRG